MKRPNRKNAWPALLAICLLALSGMPLSAENTVRVTNIEQTVVQMEVSSGVDNETVGEIMIHKAIEADLTFVSRQRVHEVLRKQGLETPHLEIFQFCRPEDARRMILRDTIYAAYMPCRIALVEDQDGSMWLMMLNLDMLINSETLPVDLNEIAVRINQAMLQVMVAGATGEL